MTSERGLFLQAVQDFEVTIADTPDKLEAAYRLRHQVYCLERGYEPGRGTLETDRYDARASHALLTQRSTGRVVGTVRVVAPSLDGLGADLPMQRLCAADAFRALPKLSTAETNGRAAAEQKRRAERSGPSGLPGCCAAQLGGGLTGVRGERWRFLLCARR